MKVTKIIREYVEKTVKAIPKFKELSPEEKEYKELCDKCSNFQLEVANEVEHFVKEAIERFKKENNIPEDVAITWHGAYYPVAVSSYNCEIHREATTKKNARVAACNSAIEDILVTLELGGTRAELDEMLKQLAE